MGQQYDRIDDRLRTFIEEQHLFFVATAARDGRVNVSPKGLDSLRVLGPNQVVWLNGTGSGNETAAHLLDTDRMTIMFASFEAKPMILRLYGHATTIHRDEPGWTDHLARFPTMHGARQIYVMDVDLVQTSCGFAVPFMSFVEDRPTLETWAEKRGPDGLDDYWQQKNRRSIDGFDTGLPASAAR